MSVIVASGWVRQEAGLFQDSLGCSFLRIKQRFIHLLKNKTRQEKRKKNTHSMSTNLIPV